MYTGQCTNDTGALSARMRRGGAEDLDKNKVFPSLSPSLLPSLLLLLPSLLSFLFCFIFFRDGAIL